MTTIQIPTLYRGDSIPKPVKNQNKAHRGRTFANYFDTEGVFAKSVDGGWSQDINRDLPELVLSHIGYTQDKNEQRQAYHSPLISFSTNEDHSFTFMKRNKKSIKECKFDDAEYFIWKFDNAIGTLTQTNHVYRFAYKTSTSNVKHLIKTPEPSMNDSELFKSIGQMFVHRELEKNSQNEQALIIDAVNYLAAFKPTDSQKERYVQAEERAKRWSEWIIYPCSPMPNGQHGVSSRFNLNDNLFAHKYFRRSN